MGTNMSERFTEILRAASEPAWSDAVRHRFVNELFAGGIPIARADAGIPTRTSLPFDRVHDRCLSRLPERSHKAAGLRWPRHGLEPAMASHR